MQIQKKVLSQKLSRKPQLTSAEVPCFESNEDRAQHCLKDEWTLTVQLFLIKKPDSNLNKN